MPSANNFTSHGGAASGTQIVDKVLGNSYNVVRRVYDSIGKVDVVSDNIENVNAINENITDVNTVSSNIIDVNAVAAIDENITAVANNTVDISTVADNIADINSVADNLILLGSVVQDVQEQIDLAVDGKKDLFVGGVDYVVGVDTELTLSNTPAQINTVHVYFNGVYQNKDTFTRVNRVVTFSEPITVDSVEIQYQVPSMYVDLTSPAAQEFEATVENSKINAEIAAVNSTTQASLATSARVGAEAARDAALFRAEAYSSVTAALADASLAVGEQFAAVSADLLTVGIYRKDAGPVAFGPLVSYPTAQVVADLLSRLPEQVRFVILPPESGWLFGILDDNNNIAISVDVAGKTWFSPRTDVQMLMDNMPQAVKDAVTGLPAGFASRLLPLGFSTLTGTPPESGFIHAFIDQQRRIGFGIKADGTFWAKLSDDVELPSTLTAAAVAAATAAILPSATIEAWGDSMTAGAGGGGTTYPGVLATLLGRVVSNRGIGGQTSEQIIARQGGLPLTVSVNGNEIPASGGVAVLAKNVNILRASGVNTGTNSGTLCGVPGVLSTDLDSNWTFTRTTAGSAVPCPPNSVYTPDLAVTGKDKTVILWVGRNDANTSRTERLATVSNAIAAVGYLSPLQKRVLVISICNNSGETSGSTAYGEIIETNDALRAAFGDCFLDVREYLVNYGLVDAGITPTAQDLIDVGNDVIPASLRSDSTHLNAAGYTLVANFISRAIRAKGW